jgi:hypothetical protein
MLSVILLVGALANCDEPRDFDSVVADCQKVAYEYAAEMKTGKDAGTVSAQATSAASFADRAAEAATAAADKATEAAGAADSVGGTLPEGAADDAEAAATEASDAASEATSKGVEVGTAVGAIDSKIDAKESHTVTGEELADAKDSIKSAVEAGHAAMAKAKIANEQAAKAVKATEDAVGEAGKAALDVAAEAKDAQITADKAVKTADGSAAKAKEEAQYATDVADKIEAKFDVDADPVTKAVVDGLRADSGEADKYATSAEEAADAVETAWSDTETAKGPVDAGVDAQEPHTVTADEVSSLTDALATLAEKEDEATKAADDAEHYAEIAYEAAKKEESVRLLNEPPAGSVLKFLQAKKQAPRRA